MPIDFDNIWVQGILIGVVSALAVALISLIVRLMRKAGSALFMVLRRTLRRRSGLQIYRQELDTKTLCISHPWMKEDQTLDDILVSVNLQTEEATAAILLDTYLENIFQQPPAPRILVLGKPGSGKSVALRLIARTIWDLELDTRLVPVLLTFSDIKGLHTYDDLVQKTVQTMQYYQFEQGHRGRVTAEAFVRDNLHEGKILLLFDGYDELDASARAEAADLLDTVLGTYRRIPAVISSRSAVYHSSPAFDTLCPQQVTIAPFTPFDILRFLTHWHFEGTKSAQDLFRMINGAAHLSELAANPLMLTIIAFLYSLPKYTLPDNRVQFYEQCTRALLEEWDTAKDILRANHFEAHQKIRVLDRVAFDHISRAAQTDELVDEDRIFELAREEMKALSLKAHEYPRMVTEIVQNSGLLQFIPLHEYRFPHRTFMEFFAADHLATQKTAEDLLDLFELDPERWRQTLLLYMGCNKNQEYANTVLLYLKNQAEARHQVGGTPDHLVFESLTECAVPDPQLASEILDLAGSLLAAKVPSPEIIEQLGYIGANPRWAHAQQAKDVLLGLLDQPLLEDTHQQVLFALLHTRDPRINDIVAKNLRNLDFTSFFSALTTDATPFVHRLLSLDLNIQEKQRVVSGLREAGNLGILAALLAESSDRQIRELTACALFSMSKVQGFEALLDETEIASMHPKTRRQVERAYAEWGWRWDQPQTEAGKKLAVLICLLTAKALARDSDALGDINLEETDNRFRFLSTGFLVESGVAFHRFNLIVHRGAEPCAASLAGLRRYWQGRYNLDSFRFSLLGAGFAKAMWRIVMEVIWPLALLGGLIGLFFRYVGWTSTSFYTYLYDDFTIAYLILGPLIWALGAVPRFLYIGRKGFGAVVDAFLAGLWLGPYLMFSWLMKKQFPLQAFVIALVCIALGFAQWLLPLQSVIWSAVLCIYFLYLGPAVLDESRLDLMIVGDRDPRQVSQFLARRRNWVGELH